MPKPTKKQMESEARCRICDRPLGRRRKDPGIGFYECCCRTGLCGSCCSGDITEE